MAGLSGGARSAFLLQTLELPEGAIEIAIIAGGEDRGGGGGDIGFRVHGRKTPLRFEFTAGGGKIRGGRRARFAGKWIGMWGKKILKILVNGEMRCSE
jgi:hypothetical protein